MHALSSPLYHACFAEHRSTIDRNNGLEDFINPIQETVFLQCLCGQKACRVIAKPQHYEQLHWKLPFVVATRASLKNTVAAHITVKSIPPTYPVEVTFVLKLIGTSVLLHSCLHVDCSFQMHI